MKMLSLENELKGNAYPGRGIVIGKTKDGKKAAIAYFIMGRSENSRNRVFVEEGEGIRTQAFDPSKLRDPSLIIYAPVRVLGNKTIVTNGDQTDTVYELMDKQQTFEQALRTRESRTPENFICSSLSILPIFSARQLISWNQPSAGRYCSRPGMGDSTFAIRKGMLLFPSCPLVRESIFCSGFSLPER